MSQTRHTALERAYAEAWYLGVENSAHRRPALRFRLLDPLPGFAQWLKERRDRNAARILVDGALSFRPTIASAAAVLELRQQLQHYGRWIAHRFAAMNIERLERAAGREQRWGVPVRQDGSRIARWVVGIAFFFLILVSSPVWLLGWFAYILATTIVRVLRAELADATR
jgi:hypothetical protein